MHRPLLPRSLLLPLPPLPAKSPVLPLVPQAAQEALPPLPALSPVLLLVPQAAREALPPLPALSLVLPLVPQVAQGALPQSLELLQVHTLLWPCQLAQAVPALECAFWVCAADSPVCRQWHDADGCVARVASEPDAWLASRHSWCTTRCCPCRLSRHCPWCFPWRPRRPRRPSRLSRHCPGASPGAPGGPGGPPAVPGTTPGPHPSQAMPACLLWRVQPRSGCRQQTASSGVNVLWVASAADAQLDCRHPRSPRWTRRPSGSFR